MPADDLDVVSCASREEWDAWLRAHPDAAGAWLRISKKGAAAQTLSYAESLEVALCHGWIDGQKRAGDDEHWLQRFTPRKAGSRWSKRNRDAAEVLIERGAMNPAGLREVENAKQDGRWDAAYDGARTATVPDDLRAALDASPRAKEFFATLKGANRYAILYRIQDAKKPETRARRIEKFVAMLEAGETIHG
jgi:uncharacterized protein YdeI (YjbR/CyaY-like superfamily)